MEIRRHSAQIGNCFSLNASSRINLRMHDYDSRFSVVNKRVVQTICNQYCNVLSNVNLVRVMII